MLNMDHSNGLYASRGLAGVPHSCTWGARETVRDGTTRILPQAEVCCDVSYSCFVPCLTSTGESATTVFAPSSSFSPLAPMLFAFATSAVDRVLCLVDLWVLHPLRPGQLQQQTSQLALP